MSRKNIGPKLRFEIFKRDSFKCQYCGATAPNALLRVDHINPVSNGGDNNILNLITSCFDCNSGKSNRLLSENSVLDKQRKQLEELEERRVQLNMMIEWHNSLRKEKDIKVEQILNYLFELTSEKISDCQLIDIKRICRKHELNEIFSAIDDTADYYLYKAKKDYAEDERVQDKYENYNQYFLYRFLKKLPGVLKNKKREKEDPDYPFINQIYKHHKYNTKLGNFGYSYFNFKFIEELYMKLKRAGGKPNKIKIVLCKEHWEYPEQMADAVNNFVSKLNTNSP